METELSAEQKSNQELLKEIRRNDRKLKETLGKLDEEKKIQIELYASVEHLNAKILLYKKQIDESENVASLNLSKWRNSQNELEETIKRCSLLEQQIDKFKLLRKANNDQFSN